MKKISLIFFSLIALLSFSSCDTNAGDQKMTQYYSNCFNDVIDIKGGTENIFTGVSYSIEYNYTQATANVTISGLKLSNSSSISSITIPDLSWSYDSDGWRTIKSTYAVTSSGVTFSDIKIAFLDRYSGTSYVPAVEIHYTVNDQYQVYSVSKQQFMFGTTTSTCTDASASEMFFSNADSYYGFDIDTDTKTANVYLYNAQFLSTMPQLSNMQFANLPFTVKSGNITIKQDADNVLTPSISSTPYPAFPITNFNAYLSSANGSISFTCAYKDIPFDILCQATSTPTSTTTAE
jgi:hypothetical protein